MIFLCFLSFQITIYEVYNYLSINHQAIYLSICLPIHPSGVCVCVIWYSVSYDWRVEREGRNGAAAQRRDARRSSEWSALLFLQLSNFFSGITYIYVWITLTMNVKIMSKINHVLQFIHCKKNLFFLCQLHKKEITREIS